MPGSLALGPLLCSVEVGQEALGWRRLAAGVSGVSRGSVRLIAAGAVRLVCHVVCGTFLRICFVTVVRI